MIGASFEQEQYLGRRPLRKCEIWVEESNIVFIDVESDNFENIVINDSPKSLPTNNGDGFERLTEGNKVPTRNSLKGGILLDGDENIEDDFVGIGVKSGRNFENGASTSCKSNTSSVNFGSPSTAKINGCKLVQENESPGNLSKGKCKYSGKATRGNCCGLGDYPDCELTEDSLGSVKEQWEKDCSKNRCNLQNGQPGQGHSNEDTVDASKNLNLAKDCGQFEETPTVRKQAEGEAAYSFIHKKEGNAGFMMGDREKLKQTDEYKKALEEELASRQRALQAEDEAAYSFIHEKKGNAGLMMGDREKLKQTDEYKKALEEELASRQRTLQAQAEEAQKLRRLQTRMKAEVARKCDMERRQKQRVEEIRETQKKAEEAQKQLLETRMKAKAARKLDMERRQKERAAEIQETQKKAEEAQKQLLETRIKAEAARKLDMERRQKERVAEIRETQKKDENNSNLKEIVRADVRKGLKTLELTCRDMASLLLGLGIPVGDGLHPPLSSEVHAAYKRALLAFHPDRASRSDIRKQVEAEEKFKLINRMKEKFPSS